MRTYEVIPHVVITSSSTKSCTIYVRIVKSAQAYIECVRAKDNVVLIVSELTHCMIMLL